MVVSQKTGKLDTTAVGNAGQIGPGPITLPDFAGRHPVSIVTDGQDKTTIVAENGLSHPGTVVDLANLRPPLLIVKQFDHS